MRRRIPLRGPARTPPLAAPARGGRRAGRARLVSRLQAPLRPGRPGALRPTCSMPRYRAGHRAARWSSSLVFGLYQSGGATRPARLRAGAAAVVVRDAAHGRLHRAAAPGGDQRARRRRARRGVAAARRHRALLPAPARVHLRARASWCAPSSSARCAASAPARTRATCSSSAPATAAASCCARSCATRSSGYRPVGFVDDDPRKRGMRHRGRRQGAGRDRRAAAHPRRGRARRGHHRDPVGARARCAAAWSRACRERGIPVRTLPTVFELLQTGGRDGAAGARGAGRGRARARAGAHGARARGRLPRRARSCSSPARAARSARELCRQIARVAPAQARCSLDHAEDNLFEIPRELEEDRHVTVAPAGARRLQGGGADAGGVRRAPARRRLPRRRLQARRR